MSLLKRLYVTYTKKNIESGEIYSGRASGNITNESIDDEAAEQILAKRDSSHHKNEDGFDLAKIDIYSLDADATRGREQLLIEHFGGAKSED